MSSQKTHKNQSTVIQEELGVKSTKLNTLYVTPLGELAAKYDIDKAYGKVINSDGKITYHIKCNSQRQPFNPYDREYELNSRRMGMRLGKETFHYELVSESGMKNYVSYLKTRQPKFYRNVLGEMK